MIKWCSKCQSVVDDGDLYCPLCGKKAEVVFEKTVEHLLENKPANVGAPAEKSESRGTRVSDATAVLWSAIILIVVFAAAGLTAYTLGRDSASSGSAAKSSAIVVETATPQASAKKKKSAVAAASPGPAPSPSLSPSASPEPAVVNDTPASLPSETVPSQAQAPAKNEEPQLEAVPVAPTEVPSEVSGNAGNVPLELNAQGFYTFGSYPQSSVNDSFVEPIEWYVLDREKNDVLLLARYGLDVQPYDTKAGGVTWQDCSVRHWLNNDFYEKAFTSGDQAQILDTAVQNANNTVYHSLGGMDTTDKVFLLSSSEARAFCKDKGRIDTKPTAYALARGAFAKTNTGLSWAGNGRWWLRSPGQKQSNAALVDFNGLVSFTYHVNWSGALVRPAVWVSLEPLAE